MQDNKREERISETREAAIALLEDYEHLKQIVSEVATRPNDLRRASAVVRRWLVDRQLSLVADPRVGRLQILAIDNNPIYLAEGRGGLLSFVSGGASIHGVYIAAGMMTEGDQQDPVPDYDPDNLIELSLKNFSKQRVIYTEGTWLTRLQVIKFVANVDHGVHGGSIREPWEALLRRFRQSISVTLTPGADGKPLPCFRWVNDPVGVGSPLEAYDPKRVNGSLLELLATISFLVNSPAIKNLAEEISTELI